MVKGKEGLFPVMSVRQNNGAEGVFFKGHGRFIKKVYVRVTHIFKFHKAQ